jgi:hypothetical protein
MKLRRLKKLQSRNSGQDAEHTRITAELMEMLAEFEACGLLETEEPQLADQSLHRTAIRRLADKSSAVEVDIDDL